MGLTELNGEILFIRHVTPRQWTPARWQTSCRRITGFRGWCGLQLVFEPDEIDFVKGRRE